MKNLVKSSLLIAAIVIGFASTTFAQSAANAISTAVLITPLTITKTADLSFATLASSATLGTAVIVPATGAMGVTGGVTHIDGTETDATFTVAGEDNEILDVSLTNATVSLSKGSGTDLDVTLIKYAVDGAGDLTFPGTATIPVGGSFFLTVGGTLTIPANHASGTYTNGTDLEVTVNYQ